MDTKKIETRTMTCSQMRFVFTSQFFVSTYISLPRVLASSFAKISMHGKNDATRWELEKNGQILKILTTDQFCGLRPMWVLARSIKYECSFFDYITIFCLNRINRLSHNPLNISTWIPSVLVHLSTVSSPNSQRHLTRIVDFRLLSAKKAITSNFAG